MYMVLHIKNEGIYSTVCDLMLSPSCTVQVYMVQNKEYLKLRLILANFKVHGSDSEYSKVSLTWAGHLWCTDLSYSLDWTPPGVLTFPMVWSGPLLVNWPFLWPGLVPSWWTDLSYGLDWSPTGVYWPFLWPGLVPSWCTDLSYGLDWSPPGVLTHS